MLDAKFNLLNRAVFFELNLVENTIMTDLPKENKRRLTGSINRSKSTYFWNLCHS